MRIIDTVKFFLSKKYAGTGLGLNLCKRFVKLHGGKIWAESVLGQGSKFIFTMPANTGGIINP